MSSTMASFKNSSLRRKDTMWIYKNPQGLMLLDDELKERRKKRFARNRTSPSPQHGLQSPPLSPKMLKPEHVIPIAMPVMEKVSSISQIKQTLENKNAAQTIVRPLNNKRAFSRQVTNKQVEPKKEPLFKATTESPVNKPERPLFIKNNLSSRTQLFESPEKKVVQEVPAKKEIELAGKRDVESRKQSLYNLDTAKKGTQPTRNDMQTTRNNLREASSPSSYMIKSRPAKVTSPNEQGNFLLEAKQKLFAVQQQQQQEIQKPIRKSLPTAPKDQNNVVSSFISAFEKPSSPPPKPPRHFEMPSTTPSASTPLTPPNNKVIPVATKSSILPQEESYFTAVIDRRFNVSPSEETIQLYLPQLSPEISFCNSTLDIPSDDEMERPGIKKRVSFSDQLSTVIPEDEEEEPMSKFTRTLSSGLIEASTALAAEKKVNVLPRDKYVPVAVKPVSPVKSARPNLNSTPQKLSNKLLDKFQKKPKTTNMPTAAPPTLTHLTKSRPRKPASLKKPTSLAYPAAIAQPDWRTRTTSSKKLI